MKKILSVMLLAAVLIIVGGQNNQAEAREVYMGSYSDGTSVYLLTETVAYLGRGIDCTVRAGRDYLKYSFSLSGDYSNSEGYRGNIYDGSSPVARNIFTYIRNNF